MRNVLLRALRLDEFTRAPSPAPRAEVISTQSAPRAVERCRRRHAPAERREWPPTTLVELARRAGVSMPVAQTWAARWDAVRPRCKRALEAAALAYGRPA
jgi:hypothetical protein